MNCVTMFTSIQYIEMWLKLDGHSEFEHKIIRQFSVFFLTRIWCELLCDNIKSINYWQFKKCSNEVRNVYLMNSYVGIEKFT